MFRTFATLMPNGARDLVGLHPSDLVALLELTWDNRFANAGFELGHPFNRSELDGMGGTWMGQFFNGPVPAPIAPIVNVIRRSERRMLWDHLIYAYMIENTFVFQIFKLLVKDVVHGEKHGTLTAPTQRWLRNTEELFYRCPAPFFIPAINSNVRPSLEAQRLNAYQRMFGKELNRPQKDKGHEYVQSDIANTEFIPTLEELLREVWIGRTNARNISGPSPVDDRRIADLAKKLHDMLISRRKYGTLSREEFIHVSTLSWFHMTLESDLPIIVDLASEAASPAERLFKIAQKVGLPAHALAQSYFEIAPPISRIMTLIETSVFNNPANAPALYTLPGPVGEDMFAIINHWETISGKKLKESK